MSALIPQIFSLIWYHIVGLGDCMTQLLLSNYHKKPDFVKVKVQNVQHFLSLLCNILVI